MSCHLLLGRTIHSIVGKQPGVPASGTIRYPEPLQILDIIMPGANGLEPLSFFRDDPTFATLPVIILSARVRPSDRPATADLNAAHPAKPTDARVGRTASTRTTSRPRTGWRSGRR